MCVCVCKIKNMKIKNTSVRTHCEYGTGRFAIPFGFSTSLGLTVRALDLPLSPLEAADGDPSSSPLPSRNKLHIPL
jgi:hypothetical protein